MTRWYDIFLWLWAGSWLVSASCVWVIAVRNVGLFGETTSGWMKEFDPVDRIILNLAGYFLFAGLISLVVYFFFYI